ncbi:MAG: NADH-quinone oxidoreductase subunit J [Deltaproteobacteria bacterium]|nr:MAG: NADH-quinone oxidoreductase subunit J [Deltaproteobacteria bacterium]
METMLFYFFAFVAVATALLVITRRNPIHSALWLVLCFFSLAAVYVLLSAHFIAIIQIMVYVGAIMVLVLFVIMLLNLSEKELGDAKPTVLKFCGVILSGIFMVLLADGVKVLAPQAAVSVDEKFGTAEMLGRLLFTDYLLPFEIASLLLLTAMIGAVVLAKKRR